jgi:hypothetical protein
MLQSSVACPFAFGPVGLPLPHCGRRMWYYKIAHPWREKGTEVPVSPSGAYTNDLTSFHQALLPKGSTTSQHHNLWNQAFNTGVFLRHSTSKLQYHAVVVAMDVQCGCTYRARRRIKLCMLTVHWHWRDRYFQSETLLSKSFSCSI